MFCVHGKVVLQFSFVTTHKKVLSACVCVYACVYLSLLEATTHVKVKRHNKWRGLCSTFPQRRLFLKGMHPCTQNFQRNVSMQTNLSSANDSIFHYCMTDTYFWVQKLICVSKLALVSLLVNVTCHCFCACVMTRLVVQIILPLSTQFSYKLVRPFTQTLVSPKPALPWPGPALLHLHTSAIRTRSLMSSCRQRCYLSAMILINLMLPELSNSQNDVR